MQPRRGDVLVWRNNIDFADTAEVRVNLGGPGVDGPSPGGSDMRLVHAGLPPYRAPKYSLNCFLLDEAVLDRMDALPM